MPILTRFFGNLSKVPMNISGIIDFGFFGLFSAFALEILSATDIRIIDIFLENLLTI